MDSEKTRKNRNDQARGVSQAERVGRGRRGRGWFRQLTRREDEFARDGIKCELDGNHMCICGCGLCGGRVDGNVNVVIGTGEGTG